MHRSSTSLRVAEMASDRNIVGDLTTYYPSAHELRARLEGTEETWRRRW